MTTGDNAVVDWATVLARFDGRRDFVVKLADIALQAHAGLPDKLERALAGKDIATLRFLAHSVKGICTNFHAPSLWELAWETEKAATAGADTAYDLAPKLVERVRALVEDVALWRQENGPIR